MITDLLSTKSLLRQFLAFNLLVFLILGFFTYLYLLAIEPELINKKSKKHKNIIENINQNIKTQNIEPNESSLKIFLYKSSFILDEVDQIRFFDKKKNIIVDSTLIDIDRNSLFSTERIQTLGINEKVNQQENKLDTNKVFNQNLEFLDQINSKLNQEFYVFSENINNSFDSYQNAIDWINKNFKDNKYLSFNIIEV